MALWQGCVLASCTYVCAGWVLPCCLRHVCCLQAGTLRLEQCDITSSSGVGVGVEGADVGLINCSIHDCERHGVAVFGSLEGKQGRTAATLCSILVLCVGLGMKATSWVGLACQSAACCSTLLMWLHILASSLGVRMTESTSSLLLLNACALHTPRCHFTCR